MLIFLLIIKICEVLSMDNVTVDLLTPAREFGEGCGYDACPKSLDGSMNVHVVPHTHGELGYTRTFMEHYTGYDQYYDKTKLNMKHILDFVITQLWSNENRKFTISDIAYFFHWWSQRDATVRRMVYHLLRQGRLFLVGGGWSMSDEATTSYHSIIDHFTYSLRKINATFLECGRPLVSWQSDVFGHSREFASLMAQMGFDGHFINPISYDDEFSRMQRNALEFIWRGSDDLGPNSDIYTHKLFDGYWSPPGFCFGGQCNDPLLVTSDSMFKNVEERVTTFIKSVRHRQGPYYTTGNIMVIFGQRFGYYDAERWFKNIDKLIDNVNKKSLESGLAINMFYSSPSCYLKSVIEANPSLETKQDDFFPYAYDKTSHATGFYTSRPSLKYLIREGHLHLQVAKQLQITAKLKHNAKFFEDFMWIDGVVQDHNIITGSLRQHVKDHYTEKLHHNIQASTKLIQQAFNKLRSSPYNTTYFRCKFNESACRNCNSLQYFIVIYNPLAWNVTVNVRLPMFGYQYVIYHPSGFRMKASIIPTAAPVMRIPTRRTKADTELVFIAEDIPPLGYRSYYLRHRHVGWYRNKRSIKKVNHGVKYLQHDKFNITDLTFNFDPTSRSTVKANIDKNIKNKIVFRNAGRSDNFDVTLIPREKYEKPTDVKGTKFVDKLNKQLTEYYKVLQRLKILRNKIERSTNAKDKERIKKAMKFHEWSPDSNDFVERNEDYDAKRTEDYDMVTSINNEQNPIYDSKEDVEETTTENNETTTDINIDISTDTFIDTGTDNIDDTTTTTLTTDKSSEIYSVIPYNNDTLKHIIITDKPIVNIYNAITPNTNIDRINNITDKIDESSNIRNKFNKITNNRKNNENDKMNVQVNHYDTNKNNKIDTESSTIAYYTVRREVTERYHSEDVFDKYNKNINTKVLNSDIKSNFLPERFNSDIDYKFDDNIEKVEKVDLDEVTSVKYNKYGSYHKGNHGVFENYGIDESDELTTEVLKLRLDPIEDDTTTTTDKPKKATRTKPVNNLNELFKSESKEIIPKKDNKLKEFLQNDPKEIIFEVNNIDSLKEILSDKNIVRNKINKVTFNNSDKEINKKPHNIKDYFKTEDSSSSDRNDNDKKKEINKSINNKVARNKSEILAEIDDTEENPHEYLWNDYNFVKSKDDFIRNKYITLKMDKNGKINTIHLSNGVNVTLDIQYNYYVSDDPKRFHREDKNPGAYIFRTMDPFIVPINDIKTKVYKNKLVQEIHTEYSNYASFVARLYRRKPVIEIDWVVGPIPDEDQLGKELFIRYKTNLNNKGVFYTDSNGRQTIKRLRNKRAMYEPLTPDPISGNFYPITSKIHIEDEKQNLRFAVFNDRAQGGSSLNDGEIDIMLNRRLFTDDAGIQIVLNETEAYQGIVIRGTHYLYITKADYKPNKIFEKKFAKEIELKPIIMVSSGDPYGVKTKQTWMGQTNEFSALKYNLPMGIHLLTLENWGDKLLIRLENYLEKDDTIKSGVKMVYLKEIFVNIIIIDARETTLGANMWLEEKLQPVWSKQEKFLKNFNKAYGTEHSETVDDKLPTDYKILELDKGVRLAPQQIRTFVVTYKYDGIY